LLVERRIKDASILGHNTSLPDVSRGRLERQYEHDAEKRDSKYARKSWLPSPEMYSCFIGLPGVNYKESRQKKSSSQETSMRWGEDSHGSIGYCI
jgi:hypothetical protein